jgi:hypothetical protein
MPNVERSRGHQSLYYAYYAYLGSSLSGAGEHQSVLISAQGSSRSSAHSRGQPCHRWPHNAVQQIEKAIFSVAMFGKQNPSILKVEDRETL